MISSSSMSFFLVEEILVSCLLDHGIYIYIYTHTHTHVKIYTYFNDCSYGIWKFSGQGLNLSCSCDLCHSCGNASPFTQCTGPGIEPEPLKSDS